MKVLLKPLYSQLNPGVGHCALGCQEVCRVSAQSSLCPPQDSTCPLSKHQAETCAIVQSGEADVIFNTAATGDGKSLAAYLPGLLNHEFRIMSLYPTIELVTDQERQIQGYCQKFRVDGVVQVDKLYGAELAHRVEQAEKGNKFKELLISLKQKQIILTNPDIFHLVAHFRYQNPAYRRSLLPETLARNPDLYVADEFHIFGVHQETAILNSLLLIRHIRSRKRPLKFLFTSATPKQDFICKLKTAGFKVATVSGNYASENTPGFRQILQPVNLEFVQLVQDADSLTWLVDQAEMILKILETEQKGRGLIILNSVAQVGRAVRKLQELLPENRVKVKEVSGRIDRQERTETQRELDSASQSVLVIGTSAVDVGVDFRIHLLIFETSDSATFIQRLGRLGRHEGFSTYKAFVLLPSRTSWVGARLKEKLVDGCEISRIKSHDEDLDFRGVIEYAFAPPEDPDQRLRYCNYWGALQAQGMLFSMSQKKDGVMQSLQDRMANDLRRVYGEQLDKKRGHWCALGKDKDKTGAAIQQELLRFRGGSDLQAAIWDGARFYIYDLLRLLPYAEVEMINRDVFLQEAQRYNHTATEFDDRYIQVYLKLQRWSDERFPIGLECDRGTDELKQCTLTLIPKLSITGHPQTEVGRCLRKQNLLTFLVQVNRSQPSSHWDISKTLGLSSTFGLYRLTDADDQVYACAFNQDALLLETLKRRLKPCKKSNPYIY